MRNALIFDYQIKSGNTDTPHRKALALRGTKPENSPSGKSRLSCILVFIVWATIVNSLFQVNAAT